MSYNGSGTFVINSAGTPYVSGTVISSTAANSLNSDLATGLSTAICKDGQSTPTANIGLGGFKITNLGAGTVASDAARLSQVQNSGTTTLIAITGTDTITGTVSPTLSAYVAGQAFSFIIASTNTGAVTLNINSLGATAVTRTGAVALVAGDMVTGQVAIVEYDGTRFQLLNGNSFTNLKASGTLGVTGITTVAAGSAAAPSIVSTTGTADTGQFFPAADTIAYSTAGTERVRITSGGNVGIGTSSPSGRLHVSGGYAGFEYNSGGAYPSYNTWFGAIGTNFQNGASYLDFWNTVGSGFQWHIQTAASTQTSVMTIDSSGNVGIGTNVPTAPLHVNSASNPQIKFGGSSAAYFWSLDREASAGDFAISNANGGGATERMRISAGGDLLLGTTSSGGVGFTVATDAAGRILTSNVSAVPFDVYLFKNSGTTVGKITINTSTTAYTTSSDYRLKQDIQPMTGALAKISALKPVAYKWKIDNSDGQGFIAHELAEIMPDCVTGKKDATEEQEYEISPAIPAVVDADGNVTTPAVEAVKGTRTVPSYQGVDASFLVATLTAAIQEQQAIIETLTARITALETL